MILVAATLDLNYNRDSPRVCLFHSFSGGIRSVVCLLFSRKQVVRGPASDEEVACSIPSDGMVCMLVLQ